MIPRKDRLHERLEVDILTNETTRCIGFHSLNISSSGVLIASYARVNLAKNQNIIICIDPFREYLEKPVVCQGIVARTVKPASKGIRKYLNMRGEDIDITTICGVKFEGLSTHEIDMIELFVNEHLSRAA